MADISGLIITVLGVGAEITSKLYQYGKQVKGASRDILALSGELYSLLGILEQVKRQQEQALLSDDETLVNKTEAIGSPDASSKDPSCGPADNDAAVESQRSSTRSVLNQTLEFLQQFLQDLVPKKGRFASKLQLLQWPFKEVDVQKHLQRLERVKTYFLLSLVTDEADQSRKVFDEIISLQSMISEISLDNHDSKRHNDFTKVMDWLSPVSPQSTRDTLSKTRTEGTGVWFTNKASSFENWKDASSGESRTLWINGFTGAGKSVLMTAAVDRLFSSIALAGDIAYFYCSFSNDETLKTINVLGSLLSQLLQMSDPGYDDLLAQYNALCAQTNDRPTRPEKQTLVNAMCQRAGSENPTYFLIDGLNECGDPTEILEALQSVTETCSNVRILISSINEKGIEEQLERFPKVHIETLSPRSANMRHDIHLLISSSLNTSSRLKRLPADLKADVEYALTHGAQGMFRWAQCQLDLLSRKRTPGGVREALKHLPPTLEKTYEQLLLGIEEGEDRDLTRQILETVTFSLRPLTVDKVSEILQITPGMGKLDESKRLNNPRDILAICGSLLEYRDSRHGVGTVTLAHHSVKTYLTSDLQGPVSLFKLDPYSAHRRLAMACLTYLSFDTFVNGDSQLHRKRRALTDKQYPFGVYAGFNWPFHIQELPNFNGDTDPELWSVLQTFLFGPAFPHWVKFLVPSSAKVETTAPLYYASSFGLTTVIHFLLEMPDVDIEQRGGRGGSTPVNIAALRGQLEAVRILLDHGADPTRADLEAGLDAMQWAVFYDHPEVVELLQSRGYRFKPQGWINNKYLKWPDGLRRLMRKPYVDKGVVESLNSSVERGADVKSVELANEDKLQQEGNQIEEADIVEIRPKMFRGHPD